MTKEKKNNLNWRKKNEHLPEFMRAYADQGELIAALHNCFANKDECPISRIEGHTYTIDWFLWFMAIHGYTLQKTRVNVEYRDINDAIEAGRNYEI